MKNVPVAEESGVNFLKVGIVGVICEPVVLDLEVVAALMFGFHHDLERALHLWDGVLHFILNSI